jgi:hypothetical protein
MPQGLVLTMRANLCAMKTLPHPEERAKGARLEGRTMSVQRFADQTPATVMPSTRMVGASVP